MLCVYVIISLIVVLITNFLRFHLTLILENKTTIESIEKKSEAFESPFDIGRKRNWEQVFGVNKLLWPLPLVCSSGKPTVDGVYWPKTAE